MLLSVVARSGGLSMVLGMMLLLAESSYAAFVGPIVQLADLSGFPSFLRPFTGGWIAALYQQSWSFNAANWTYLTQWRRAPVTFGLILLSKPRPAVTSALVLVAFTVVGLGLSLVIAGRRELSPAVGGRSVFRPWAGGSAAEQGRVGWQHRRLPRWTGRGPAVLRLTYAHLWHLRRTSLIKIGLVVGLLFPLTLVMFALIMDDPRFLFEPMVPGGPPVAVSASVFPVAPLAVVLACLAVSNELSFGTRRAALARGVTRLVAVVAESLAMIVLAAAILTWLMAACAAIGAAFGAVLPAKAAILAIGVGTLGVAVYAGAVQVGAALSRSTVGTLLAGLGLLVVDWVVFLAPTTTADPGPAMEALRYTVSGLVFGVVSGQPSLVPTPGASAVPVWTAIGLLTGVAVATHGAAVFFSWWRDA
jgi:hypothetical protein